MTIEIMKYPPINKGSLCGFVDIFIPKSGLEIYGLQVHEKNGKKWVNMPAREYIDPETKEKKYLSVVRFKDRVHQNTFNSIVLEKIRYL